MMRDIDEVANQRVDQLLVDWYEYSASYRPNLGSGRCAPECRESTSSRQYDSTADITRELADKLDMDAVQYCYDAISFPFQNAIGIEMANRREKANVWKSSQGKTYAEALEAIIPQMRRKNLL